MCRWIYVGLESKLVRFYYQKTSSTPQFCLMWPLRMLHPLVAHVFFSFFVTIEYINQKAVYWFMLYYLFIHRRKSPDGSKVKMRDEISGLWHLASWKCTEGLLPSPLLLSTFPLLPSGWNFFVPLWCQNPVIFSNMVSFLLCLSYLQCQ